MSVQQLDTIDTSTTTKLVTSLIGNKDNVITISRLVLQLLNGDYSATVVLSQAVYWTNKVDQGKGGTKDGYFWKSMGDWKKETSLSEYQVRSATKKLEKLGLLITTTRKAWSEQSEKMVPTVHYRVQVNKLLESLLCLVSSESKKPKKLQNPGNRKNCGIHITETTPKTTVTTPSPPPQALTLPTTVGGGGDQDEVEEYVRWATSRPGVRDPIGLADTIRTRIKSQGGLSDRDRNQIPPPREQGNGSTRPVIESI